MASVLLVGAFTARGAYKGFRRSSDQGQHRQRAWTVCGCSHFETRHLSLQYAI